MRGSLFLFDPQGPCQPDDQARRSEIIATIVAAVGLLVIGFALGATFGRGWMW